MTITSSTKTRLIALILCVVGISIIVLVTVSTKKPTTNEPATPENAPSTSSSAPINDVQIPMATTPIQEVAPSLVPTNTPSPVKVIAIDDEARQAFLTFTWLEEVRGLFPQNLWENKPLQEVTRFYSYLEATYDTYLPLSMLANPEQAKELFPEPDTEQIIMFLNPVVINADTIQLDIRIALAKGQVVQTNTFALEQGKLRLISSKEPKTYTLFSVDRPAHGNEKAIVEHAPGTTTAYLLKNSERVKLEEVVDTEVTNANTVFLVPEFSSKGSYVTVTNLSTSKKTFYDANTGLALALPPKVATNATTYLSSDTTWTECMNRKPTPQNTYSGYVRIYSLPSWTVIHEVVSGADEVFACLQPAPPLYPDSALYVTMPSGKMDLELARTWRYHIPSATLTQIPSIYDSP